MNHQSQILSSRDVASLINSGGDLSTVLRDLVLLGDCHFEQLEIWAVRRREEQPCASGSYDLLGGKAPMGSKIVGDGHTP